ncbi:hypothetical protein [Azoarcus sp. KH32C]|uniref:hypothetical protein n=1 Tax=Azoarcus sp. KH32C TaxID=748247 RepID=UPI0002386C83|nr:hypothetical protein [Azoarcus sp. KH32C]BAL24894.1 hypothetical protein AZKH_2588 [Azoarcus sp. KH32C]
MNSILVTGLAIGSEPEIDACSACNYDLSWLFEHPSTLLWADKIIVTEGIKNAIDGEYFAHVDKPEFSKGLKTIFEILQDAGLLDVRKAANVITPTVRDSLYEQIELDRKLMCEVFPKDTRLAADSGVPGQFFVHDYEYCTPALWSVYASLHLADTWDTNVLFSPNVYNYLRYKFGLQSDLLKSASQLTAFEKVFSSFVPETPLLPSYFIDTQCGTCTTEKTCRSNALPNLEANLRKILAWRDYDEFHEMRKVFDDLSKKRRECVDPTELIAEFEQRESKLQRRINGVFPKIERWTNLASVVAIPVALGGVTSGSTLLASSAGAIAGLAEVSKKYMEITKNRYRWLGFRNKAVKDAASKK